MLTDKHIGLMEKIEKELENSTLVFPTCFDLTLRIQQLIDDQDASTIKIANVVQSDPVLSAKLFHVANSAAMNIGGTTLTSISRIIQRTGLDMVRYLSHSIIKEQIVRDMRVKTIRQFASDLWRYSVDFSSWAYAIALDTNIVRPDNIIFNTVMVNIGQFYILHKVQKFPDLAADEDIFKEIVREYGPAVTSKILSSYGISRKIVVIKENVEKKGFDWPLKTMDDIIALSAVLTELTDPFATTNINLDDYINIHSISRSDEKEIKAFVESVRPVRNTLFEAITG